MDDGLKADLERIAEYVGGDIRTMRADGRSPVADLISLWRGTRVELELDPNDPDVFRVMEMRPMDDAALRRFVEWFDSREGGSESV